MYAYISGTIVMVLSDRIILDNQGIGYEIFTPNPFVFKKGTIDTVYTFLNIKEDAHELFGFKDQDSLEFFKRIITVKGVGPKTGLNILSKSSIDQIIKAIDESDIKYLKSLPGIGPKMASQMVLDLQGKLIMKEQPQSMPSVLDDVYDGLMQLGFKRAEINAIKEQLLTHKSDDVGTLLQYALKLLA